MKTIRMAAMFAVALLAGLVMPASAQEPSTAAKTLTGRWTDNEGGSNTLSISLTEGWKAGSFQLWCRRGLTRVDFVLKPQPGDRLYEVVKGSSPNSCGVEGFTLRPDASGWRGDINASYPTTFVVK